VLVVSLSAAQRIYPKNPLIKYQNKRSRLEEIKKRWEEAIDTNATAKISITYEINHDKEYDHQAWSEIQKDLLGLISLCDQDDTRWSVALGSPISNLVNLKRNASGIHGNVNVDANGDNNEFDKITILFSLCL
jgi:hypothetical protein